MKNTKTLFSLLANALFDKELDEKTKSDAIESIDELYKISKHHDISHLISYSLAINKVPLPECEASKKLKKRHPIALLRYEALSAAYQRMCEAFENEKLCFIPLKGAVIRELYPQPWMRTSCDIDVLVHDSDLERASCVLTQTLGYEKKQSGTHDVSFFAPNGTHIELHFKLSELFYESGSEKILNNVWDYSCKKEGSEYHRVLRDDFYYMYHVYHMAKHFEIGGCGVRPFVDLYLLDIKTGCDASAREKMLEEAGLSKFAAVCRKLYNYWFCGGDGDELVLKLHNYILYGGVYGNARNMKNLKSAKNENGLKYLCSRIFLSYDKLAVQFPVIKKHKWLTPVCEVLRWLKLFNPAYRRVAKQDLDIATAKKTDELQKMADFLEQIGLK